jgi:hypothetical protein
MTIGIIGLGDVDQLLTEINTELSNRPINPSTVASQICWDRPSQGGVGGIGKKTIYTVPFFGNRAKVRSIYEEVKGTVPSIARFASEVQEWAPDAELIPRYTKVVDIYGVVRDNAQTILAMSSIEMETQLSDLIGLGVSTTTPYDNKNFFATDHEANPNQPGLATFSNYKPDFDINYDNVNAALDLLDAVPGPDGNPLSMPGKNLLLVSTGVQEGTALTLANGEFIPNAAGTATQSNSLKGRFDVLKLPQLRRYNSGKFWCAIRVADAKNRPFSFSKALPPTMYLEGVLIDEHSQTLRSVARQGWRSVHGFGYLWPQLIVGCVES